MLIILMNKVGNVNRYKETLRKKMEKLKWEIKNAFDGLINRLGVIKEIISELKV